MSNAENHLIELLPRRERQSLLALCRPVQLILAEVLGRPGEPMRHVYFPTAGYVSLVSMIEGSAGVEVGMVGSEGLVGAHLALGMAASPSHALVQGPGEAWCIGTAAFRRAMAGNPVLLRSVNRYLYVTMVQLTNSAACVRFHALGPRLARWLLMSQDRAGSDTFPVTQGFLAYMLGVRRVGVSAAAGALQRSGSIEYRRGVVRVLDRPALRAAACGCYASDRKAYAETIG